VLCHLTVPHKKISEKNMSSENISDNSGRNHHAIIFYDYNTSNDERDNYSKKVSFFFNGNAFKFAWWKSKIYSHIMSIDDEL